MHDEPYPPLLHPPDPVVTQLRAAPGEGPPAAVFFLKTEPAPVADQPADFPVVPGVRIPMRVLAPVAAERRGVRRIECRESRGRAAQFPPILRACRPALRPVRRCRRRHKPRRRRTQGPRADQARQQKGLQAAIGAPSLRAALHGRRPPSARLGAPRRLSAAVARASLRRARGGARRRGRDRTPFAVGLRGRVGGDAAAGQRARSTRFPSACEVEGGRDAGTIFATSPAGGLGRGRDGTRRDRSGSARRRAFLCSRRKPVVLGAGKFSAAGRTSRLGVPSFLRDEETGSRRASTRGRVDRARARRRFPGGKRFLRPYAERRDREERRAFQAPSRRGPRSVTRTSEARGQRRNGGRDRHGQEEGGRGRDGQRRGPRIVRPPGGASAPRQDLVL